MVPIRCVTLRHESGASEVVLNSSLTPKWKDSNSCLNGDSGDVYFRARRLM